MEEINGTKHNSGGRCGVVVTDDYELMREIMDFASGQTRPINNVESVQFGAA